FHDQALAFAQRADIGADRGTGELGALAGIPGLDEWHGQEAGANRADHGGRGGQEPAPAGVHGLTLCCWVPAAEGSIHPVNGHPALRKILAWKRASAGTRLSPGEPLPTKSGSVTEG